MVFTMRTIVALSLALLFAACAAPATMSRAATDPLLVNEPISPKRDWLSTRELTHPLAGRIWDVRHQIFAEEGILFSEIAGSDFVFLGEVHDNPDHHLLEARLVKAITATGKRPVFAMEMLDADQQPAVDRSLAVSPRDADALARAVEWDSSGWPPFSLYRPVVSAALDAGLRVVAADLPRKMAMKIVREGSAALPEEVRERLDRDEPLGEEVVKALRDEMRESHCGALPENLLDPMALAQRATNAEMAARIEGADSAGAVIVTGSGHARIDRGISAVVARDVPGRRIISVGMIEVQSGRPSPKDYAADWGSGAILPFDYVIFTPATNRADPCEKLRAAHPQMPG